MSRRESDFIMEEEIFLGGKISAKYAEFALMAKMSPEYAELYMILSKRAEWREQADRRKRHLAMIETLGMVDFIRTCSELTRLSMILGDTRETKSAKGLMDELRARESRSDSST